MVPPEFRGLKGVLPFMRWALKTKRRSALSGYMACTALVYVYCVIGLLNFEKGENEKVATLPDALWLGFTTLTTIGYGDAYPVTTGGKVMMGILAVVGLGLFSMVTAGIASLLVEIPEATPKAQREEGQK